MRYYCQIILYAVLGNDNVGNADVIIAVFHIKKLYIYLTRIFIGSSIY